MLAGVRGRVSRCVLFLDILTVLFLGMAGWMPEACSQPANDDYENRLVVTGSSVTVTGVLAGATRQLPHEPNAPPYYGFANASLWWSWTPAETTPVVLWAQRIGSSESSAIASVIIWTNLCAQAITNALSACPGYGYVPTYVDPYLLPFGVMTFWAQPGVEHQIQLLGDNTTSYVIQWRATHAPCILQQPAGRIVSPGNSTLFKVIALGIPPLSYQWIHEGEDLPGPTGPMLGLDDIQSTDAGSYQVRVTSATGTVESDVAQLLVEVPTNSLTLSMSGPAGPDEFEIQLKAEPSRTYRLEVTTNLLSWSPLRSFPMGQNRVTSVVIATNALQDLSIPYIDSVAFVRSGLYTPDNAECVNHLKMIRFAKDLWALDTKVMSTQHPMDTDLQPYYPRGEKPLCPEGGYYLLNQNDTPPACSRTNHVLLEPRFP